MFPCDFNEVAGKDVEITFSLYEGMESRLPYINILKFHVPHN